MEAIGGFRISVRVILAAGLPVVMVWLAWFAAVSWAMVAREPQVGMETAAVSAAGSGLPIGGNLPTISGTAQEGDTLKASSGSWTGQKPIRYAYQWLRCENEGAGCESIGAATKSSYKPVAEDVGRTLRVEVSASNGVGSASATSNPTMIVAGVAPTAKTSPKITGTAKAGDLLTASSGTWGGTVPLSLAYQWQACNAAGAECSNISKAAESIYKPTSLEVGQTIRVSVTATNAAGTATVVSKATKRVVAGEPPSNTTLPVISGTPQQGNTVTTSTGSWSGAEPISYSYKWSRCRSPGECEEIPEETEASYAVSSGDVGQTLTVTVTATNAVGVVSATSAATETVLGVLANRGDTLGSGEKLEPGWYLQSSGGQYTLHMQTDGNLVEYVGGRALWASNTAGNPGAYLVLQSDGNLVVYSPSKEALWNSGTEGNPGDHLSLQVDANIVVYSSGGSALWASYTDANATLGDGEALEPGWYLQSTDGHYSLHMQTDGNLVEYVGGRALWASNTAGNPGAYLVLQSDGNLVVYSPSKEALWNSGTEGNPGDHLSLQVDANIVVYSSGGSPLWNSGIGNSTLSNGETLTGSQYLTAGNDHTFVMQTDGNLVLYGSSGALWASDTAGNPGAYAVLQGEGNLVVYSTTKQALWDSGTVNSPGDHLSVQSDGNVVVYSEGGTALWATNTVGEGGSSNGAPVIGKPPWWNGECDSGGYVGAFPLGAVWNGLVACGPRPIEEGAPDRTVHFFVGAWGEYEWECVELSMRWMYMAYGVHPYSAEGYDIVQNYSPSDGGGLVRISNGTAGQAPQPGDVIDFPGKDHTGVVTASAVNGAGNGSITIIQQNASRSGWATFSVSGWNVAEAGGWLHKP
jgi:Ig domain of plant-specific actin-binding protein